MSSVKTRILIGPDGSLSGQAAGLPPGEHEAEITLLDETAPTVLVDADRLLARVRALQAEIARRPVLDARTPEEILGYNERGHFDRW